MTRAGPSRETPNQTCANSAATQMQQCRCANNGNSVWKKHFKLTAINIPTPPQQLDGTTFAKFAETQRFKFVGF